MICCSGIKKERYQLKCTVCKQRMGAKIQCDQPNCYLAYHPMCARAAGFQVSGCSYNPVITTLFCHRRLASVGSSDRENSSTDIFQLSRVIPKDLVTQRQCSTIKWGGNALRLWKNLGSTVYSPIHHFDRLTYSFPTVGACVGGPQ